MKLSKAFTPKNRAFRRASLTVSAVLVATLLQTAAAQPASTTSTAISNLPGLPAAEKPVARGRDVAVKPRVKNKGPRVPAGAPRAEQPDPAEVTLTLPPSGAKGGERFTSAKGQPVAVGRAQGKADASETSQRGPRTVKSEVLEGKKAERAGIDGLLFTLGVGEPAQATSASAESTKQPVAVAVEYAQFSELFGGAYASRMGLVQLPVCVLTTPEVKACRSGEPVAAVNDTERKTLTAESVSLQAGAPTVLAATAAVGGDKGDYKATPLSPSSTWNTALNTGDFTWSYDMEVPEVPGALKPSVGLSYSSGAIDGRTGGTNNQGSWVGDGFDLWPGFIERSYKPCADDGVKNADGNKPGDMCWAYDNATISFNGAGGELVPAGNDEFRLKRDDGTRIKRLESADRGNGDNDGEYWRLTSPDGTRYYFGYNRLPGWSTGKSTTDSTWTLPVYGNDSGEECHAATFADSWCQQAWRWNLDYVVDTYGNAISYHYTKETNSYGRNLKSEDDTPYTRGGYLTRIDYGQRTPDLYAAKPLAQVVFDNTERCIPAAGVTCAADTIDTKAFYWYDTPWDLNCKAETTCDNGRLSPSFWTRKRLTDVTTQVLKTDGTYGKVDSWKLGHRWGMADTDYQLLLDSVQHTGQSATPTITLPKTTFAYTQLANRLDKTGDGFAPFIKDRLSSVDDESGGQISVNYSAAACDWNALPTPATNTTRCFPQYLGGSDTEAAEQHWFNKYVTNSVTSTDRTGGAPDQVTTYQYLGNAAWHFDDDDGLTKEKEKTWSHWRGYGQVRVQTGGQGGAAAMKSQEDHYFLRGMDGDRATTTGGTKSVSVSLGTDEGEPITDHESANGFPYKTVTFDKPGGKVLEKKVDRPWHHQTAEKKRSWGTVTANLTGTASAKTWTSLDNGAGSQWRITSTSNTYETVAGRVTETDDRGDNSTASDNQCTRTTYATNSTDNILSLPSRVETVAKACDVAPDRAKDVISDVRTAYDGGAYGAEPTKGDATATATLKQHDGTKATYLESGATYDSYGRQLNMTDLTANVTASGDAAPVRTVRNDGRTTVTTYTPATGFATQTKVTTPPAVSGNSGTSQSTTSEHDPLRGQPLRVTDTNDKVTEFAYDALGRSAKVWLANRYTSQTPTYAYTYTITDGKPVAVTTSTLNNAGGQITAYTLYDGFLRERQTQAPGPDGGSLLTDTFYNERGLTAKNFSTYYTTQAPSTELFAPADALSVETQTRNLYDGLGRITESRQIAGNGDGGQVLGITRTVYNGDRTTVIPPVGGTATTTLTDARDQTTELRQHHERTLDAQYDTTRYAHTPSGKLEKVTDPAGNSWTYTYDQLGRQVRTTDPDKGTTDSSYDDRGQLVSTTAASTTAARSTLHHTYDNLGRETELRKDSATGAKLVDWTYDTISGAKGQLASTTRYVNGSAYTSSVSVYDPLYRATRTAITIPAAEGALAGTYQTATVYKPSGLLQSVNYSKAGSLPGEVITYSYDDILRPTGVTGQGYSAATSYSLTGKPLQVKMTSGGTGKQTQVTNTYEWGTQRLATSRVDRQDIAGVDKYATYRYDETGNVQSVADVSRAGTDTQCFTYDHLRRVTQEWTEPASTCTSAPAAGKVGGPAPYWNSYTYDKVGNRLSETAHDLTGNQAKDTERTYAYPPPGGEKPHALTSVTSVGPTVTSRDTYAYDEVGNTTSRTVAGTTQTLSWDSEGHLATVTEPVEGAADKTTAYLYDADGSRLIGRTNTETTLYLGHTEIVLPKGSTAPKATRFIDLGNGQQAVRNDNGSIAFTIGDHHGTGQLAVDAASLALTQRRTDPFGSARGDVPTSWPSTKGFVGGTTDTSTGLTHLGAREYDPGIGRFISVDPIMDLADPQQINGYTYANNAPATLSDPTGLRPDGICGGNSSTCVPSNSVSKTTVTYNESWTKKKSGWYWKKYDENKAGKRYYTHGCLGCKNWIDRTRVIPWTEVVEAVGIFVPVLGPAADAVLGINDLIQGNYQAASERAASAVPLVGEARLAKSLLKKTRCEPNSFVPGTKVLMADGSTKPIEEVKNGDKVLATDPKSGKRKIETVTAEIKGEGTKRLVEVTIDIDGDQGSNTASITATHNHPFWVPDIGEWIDATDLESGQWLKTSAGTRVQVTAISRWTAQQATVYNLTVSDLHTYYVVAGPASVLVHNCGGYGELDEHGRATGISVTLTRDNIGGTTNPSVDPAGWVSGMGYNRSHLWGAQLGGSNSDRRNFVTLHQYANHPGMRRLENRVRRAVERNGETVQYTVTPIYAQHIGEGPANPYPLGVTIRANGSGGLDIFQTVLNRPRQ
ncbi:polymorphic toxin-type HINT domain-containing protein [Streptomyces sp. NPDC005494]|uniref:polymorphic toxin-type HINT domain-containing protein n=1 Tax=Streptomyces sp. NPDC005494 TaxID=3364715 RepID=UPI003694EC7F